MKSIPILRVGMKTGSFILDYLPITKFDEKKKRRRYPLITSVVYVRITIILFTLGS